MDEKNEKDIVKQALQAPLVLKEHWLPIATGWFEKWKAYVNFADNEEMVCSRHPGPVQNRCLKAPSFDEWRRDMVAEQDYILLPQAAAQMLLNQYGGGPQYFRLVRLFNDKSIKVDLWPLRVNAFLCDRSQPTPVSRRGPKYHRHYFYDNSGLQAVAQYMEQHHFHINVAETPTRYWLRKKRPEQITTEANGGRRLNNDAVEWDGDWYLIRSNMNVQIKWFVGDGDCMDLIIELAPCPNPQPSDWPRAHLLEAWKSDIRKDDMLDVRNVQGQFRPAGVINVDAEKNLTVRYWTGEVDWVLASDFDRRIAPLLSPRPVPSVPVVDLTIPSAQKRPRETPPAASNNTGGSKEDRAAKVQRSVVPSADPSRTGSGSISGNGGTVETPPLKVSANASKDDARVEFDTHLRRALEVHNITTPRIEALLQVLRKEEVSTLAVWQALTLNELNSLLEKHRKTLTVGLRSALRVIHQGDHNPVV